MREVAQTNVVTLQDQAGGWLHLKTWLAEYPRPRNLSLAKPSAADHGALEDHIVVGGLVVVILLIRLTCTGSTGSRWLEVVWTSTLILPLIVNIIRAVVLVVSMSVKLHVL